MRARTDEELLAATPREPDAFAELYRRHAAPLTAYFLRRTRSPEIAADLTAETFAAAFAGWDGPWNYPSPELTALRLERAGFTDVRTWRTEWPVDVDEPRTYFATVMLGSHLERLAPEYRDAYVEAVLAELPHPIRVDYVRLNIDARRP